MKSYIFYFFIASLSCCARARELFDITMFLPFLKAYESPPPCPPNELYKICTGNCSDCSQRGKCIVTTCFQGCDCAPQFFRLTPDGPCTPVSHCPKPECGENEVFRECGPVCERCTTLPCRAINCDHKCYCKAGYLRNREGICIPAEECPIRQHCSTTEVWAESGPVNEFCLVRESETVNQTQQVAQCYCKDDHKRNSLGCCINETLCSLVKCMGIEVFHDCIPKCNTTCKNYGNPNCTEDGNCYPGCFCPPGYVMNDFRACILADTCSPDTPLVKIIESSFIVEDDESTDSEDATESSVSETSKETDTTEYSGTDETVEDNTKDFSEMSTDTGYTPNQSDIGTTAGPVSSSTASVKPPKKKSGKMRDLDGKSPKRASAAAAIKQALKQDTSKDEEDFDNEEI